MNRYALIRRVPQPAPRQQYLVLNADGHEVARDERVGMACRFAARLDETQPLEGPHRVVAMRARRAVA